MNMKNIRIISSLILSLFVLFSVAAPASAATLPASTPSEWAQSDVSAAISKGFVPNELQDLYREDITRGEFCKMAVELIAATQKMTVDQLIDSWCSERYDQNGVHPAYRENVFTDTNDYYVNCAYLLGTVQGKGDGTFDPDGLVSRQEAAVMLFRAYLTYGGGIMINQKAAEFEENYTDVGIIADWAIADVQYIYELGVMNGISASTFDPMGQLTREQAIVTFWRLYGVIF
ncbi:S-layer homology domain-containing protein [Sporobacter termitidis DSM 10068]|uniref:S-layer homology domain-containing protein n=1 Tax=Sporobacter termitidis DSM 10068 TaxID=1123282 RepID=A0A1M5YS40_9FIRM|nr:S-layer homology domain-containing protein [Sporobacter termitidis]SHI14896.1 S-layer homology domain-containing protein [Sporobacter termitidis DSM 10068]